MFPKINLLLLISFVILLPAGNTQVLFQANLPENLEDNPYFQGLIAEREIIQTAVKDVMDQALQADLSENEKFYLQVWLNDISSAGGAPFREKYDLMDGASHFENIDTALLFAAGSRLLEIKEQVEAFRGIYKYEGDLMRYYTIDTVLPHIQEELRFYDLQPGGRIGEIGAGDERFAACVAATTEEVHLYVNDIDTTALWKIAYHLRYNPFFEKRGSTFSAVAGQPTSTGLETLNLDKVIVRDAFHHFDYPEEMLASIRQSIKPGGMLYLKERFAEDCDSNCCHRQMDEATIKDLLASAGFELQRETTIRDEEDTSWHLLSISAGQARR